MSYLVVPEGAGVISQGRGESLRDLVERVARLGYDRGYVTNQDGGNRDLGELIDEMGFRELVGEGMMEGDAEIDELDEWELREMAEEDREMEEARREFER